MKRSSIIVALLLASPLSALAQTKTIDFDGDGQIDVAGYEIQNDGSPNEIALTYIESSGGETVRTEFGVSEETPVYADYDGDGVTDIAVVGPTPENTLSWRLKLSAGDGAVTTSSFGLVGDTVLAGCDFDGDGKADKASVRQGAFSYESSVDQTVKGVPALGVSEFERVYCGDLDGDSKDEVLGQTSEAYQVGSGRRAKTRYRSKLYGWNAESGAKVFEKEIRSKVTAFFAADIDGNGTDEVGYGLKSAAKRINFAVDAVNVASYRIPAFTEITFPKFVKEPGASDGILLKTNGDDAYIKYSSFASLTIPEPLIIDDTESVVPVVQSALVGPSTSTEAACQIHHEASDGNEGFLWKPVSDTTGNVAVHFPRELRMRGVKFIKNGKVLETPFYGGNGNGARDLFRSRQRFGYFPSNVTVLGKANGAVHCWLVKDPAKRND